MHITATLLGYGHLCMRKVWLHAKGIRMEHTSNRVALGRLLDRTSYSDAHKAIDLEAELPDGTVLAGKVDWAELKEGVLHETKLGRSCEDAHAWQLRFYLWMLRLCGVKRSDGSDFEGVLNYPKLKKTLAVELDEVHIAALQKQVAQVSSLLAQPGPPPRIDKRSFCAKCAFEELCYS